MTEGVRLALPTDLDVLENFAAEAVHEQTENRGGTIWSKRDTRNPPYRASLESVLNNPDEDIWIGLIDDVPVGYAVAAVEMLRTGETLGIISDIWIEPQAREVGVGEELINVIIRDRKSVV